MTHKEIIAELTRIWHSPHLDLSLKAGLAEVIETLKETNQGESLVTYSSDACKESESKLDLIRRSDALDALGEEPLVWYDGEDEIAERNQWRRDKAALESLPSAEPKTREWIPVSERLPDEHEWIGTKKFGTTISDLINITFEVDGQRFVKVMSVQNGELSFSDRQTMDALYKGWKMIAWMPLPEPYREDGEA